MTQLHGHTCDGLSYSLHFKRFILRTGLVFYYIFLIVNNPSVFGIPLDVKKKSSQ